MALKLLYPRLEKAIADLVEVRQQRETQHMKPTPEVSHAEKKYKHNIHLSSYNTST